MRGGVDTRRNVCTQNHPSTCRPRSGVIRCLFAVLAAFALVGAIRAANASAHATAHATQQCDASSSAQRDPANPLDLPQAPGANPLTGAQFFVPGPAKGSAARAIAQLLGLNPETIPVDESWATFADKLAFGPLHDKLVADPSLARKVAQLSKIASQPEAQRISSYSWGGTPSGIFKQTQKILCDNLTADPGTIPIFNTYFLHPVLGGCPTPKQVRDYMPLFHSRVDAMAQGVGRHPAVFLLELDAIGSSSCVTKMGAMPEWEAELRYEMKAMQSLPHTVVYVEGGYSDSNSVGYTARILNAIGVNSIRGFFTNDTHEAWTSNEARWATAIAKKTHGRTSSSTPPTTAPVRCATTTGSTTATRTCATRPAAASGRSAPPSPAISTPMPGCGRIRPATAAGAAADLPAECSGRRAPRARPLGPTASSAPASPAVPTDKRATTREIGPDSGPFLPSAPAPKRSAHQDLADAPSRQHLRQARHYAGAPSSRRRWARGVAGRRVRLILAGTASARPPAHRLRAARGAYEDELRAWDIELVRRSSTPATRCRTGATMRGSSRWAGRWAPATASVLRGWRRRSV